MMKVTRRELLAGAAATALVPHEGYAWFPHGAQHGVFSSAVGALSGGGYYVKMSMSDDGLTRIVTYDGENAWKWNSASSQWQLLYNQNSLPAAFQKWGLANNPSRGFQVCGSCVAPNNNQRIYIVVNPGYYSKVFRSDDGGASWIDTGYRLLMSTVTNLASGKNGSCGQLRSMTQNVVVDPNNADICIISDDAGVIHYTSNAGATWTRWNLAGGPLAGILPTATATGTMAIGSKTLTLNSLPALLTGASAYYQCNIANLSRTNSLLDSGNVVFSFNAGTNTITMYGTMNADPTDSVVPSESAVQIGDVIQFGQRAFICFDRSSYVGGSSTPGIFIGWMYGAGAVYHSTDGGTTFSAMAGSPAQIQDITWGQGGYIYAVQYDPSQGYTFQNGWMYNSGAWSQITNTPTTSGRGPYYSVATDPVNASMSGVVVFMSSTGSINLSNNNAATGSWYSQSTGGIAPAGYVRTAADVPWLGPSGTMEAGFFTAGMAFDRLPANAGRLYINEGIAVWYTTPPTNAAGTNPALTWTDESKNSQTLIIDSVTKPPGQKLLLTAQDRSAIQVSSKTTEPSAQVPTYYTQIVGFVDDGSAGSSYSGVAGNVLHVTQKVNGSLINGRGLWNQDRTTFYENVSSQTSGTQEGVGLYKLAANHLYPPGTTFYAYDALIINHGWGCCYSPVNANNQWIVWGSEIWYTNDGGSNWNNPTTTTVYPGFVIPVYGGAGGGIAAVSDTNLVWTSLSSGYPAYSTDGGLTWRHCVYDGANGNSITSSSGGSASAALNVHCTSSGQFTASFSGTTMTVTAIPNFNGAFQVPLKGALSKVFDIQKGNTHTGTQTIDGLSDTSPLTVGMAISGNGVGTNATIQSIDSSTQVTATVASTGNNTATNLTFTYTTTAKIVSGPSSGGVGSYTLDTSLPVMTGTVNCKFGVVNIGGTVTGTFNLGDTLSGNGTSTGAILGNQIDGTPGGAGNYYTSDGITSNFGGVGNSYYQNMRQITSDGTSFFMFRTDASNAAGIWKSTDGGKTFVQQRVGMPTDSRTNANLASWNYDMTIMGIPGQANQLYLCSGTFAFNGYTGLLRSIDGGVTWYAVQGTTNAWQVAWGKAAPGKAYPAIYIAGYINGDTDPGVFVATDFDPASQNEPTWTRVCRAPGGDMAGVKGMSGDPEVYGTVYMGTQSNGYRYAKFN